MSDQAKNPTVVFPQDARPGVLAIGGIKRGGTAQVDAFEAVRLVDAKGLRFADGDQEREARAVVDQARAAFGLPPSGADVAPEHPSTDTLSEEH
jgi:hypothetical protein